jgi:hypothetical protein
MPFVKLLAATPFLQFLFLQRFLLLKKFRPTSLLSSEHASLIHPSENMFPLMRDRPIAMPQITTTEPPHKIPMPNNEFQVTIQEKK